MLPGKLPVFLNSEKVDQKKIVKLWNIQKSLNKITRGVPQELNRTKKIVKNTLFFIRNRMRLTVSRSQLIMLNRIETRFLLFLKTLAELLIPRTFSACLLVNLLENRLIIILSLSFSTVTNK